MDTSYIISIVYSTFKKEDVLGIMLSGSYAARMQNEDSDIDVVVLSKFACRQTTAEIIRNNSHIHYIVFPKNKIYDLIYDDMFKEKFVFFSMFSKGRIILDIDRTLFSVKKMTQGFTPSLSEHVITNLRHSITEDLSYLKKNSDAFSIALNVCIRTQQIVVGFLAPQNRYLDKVMKSFPIHRRIINNALANFVIDKDISVFSESIEKVLDEFCTIPQEYSSSDTLLRISESENIMIYIPNKKILSSCVLDIFNSCVERFPSINIFAYYIGNNSIQACGSYLSIIKSSYPQKKVLAFINDYIIKTDFSIIPQLYFPYNTIFFNLNLFGDKKFEKLVYGIFAKCSSWFLKSDNNIPFNGIELGYLTTLNLFHLLGEQKKYFVMNASMIYMPDAINLNGHAQHSELAHRYNGLFQSLNESYISNRNMLLSSFKEYLKYGTYELKQFEEISVNIMKVSLESKKMPYNSFYFIKKEHSILFNLYNQILSIFSLDNYQKMTICYNCSKINLDVLF
ncbi:nucleotidyltransferase domain-containing protein [Prevotella histicola]|uniref:Polymerase nucleotidyl transferase domain-containing protein n=1 Tax=Prevotella histicola F0411 TaxID=857291 RepID=G6AGH8_9BACT|nr:nucleotidyltransferase domain-containing protein [Prevotella histicola]EHG16237.1 hypothetical protein HMPREF9138_01399 [Prevotella histicola F0411]QUB84724.1 hypothetical protein J5A62_10785 [Prevotella histicola]